VTLLAGVLGGIHANPAATQAAVIVGQPHPFTSETVEFVLAHRARA
jgi:hypothetical protein